MDEQFDQSDLSTREKHRTRIVVRTQPFSTSFPTIEYFLIQSLIIDRVRLIIHEVRFHPNLLSIRVHIV